MAARTLRIVLLLGILSLGGLTTALATETFTLGSTTQDVLRIQGTPTGINRYQALNEEVWSYGYSKITFSIRTNRVVEWHDSGNLRVGLLPGGNTTGAAKFTKGSHKDDVLRIQGTPTGINRYQALDEEVWNYGYSTITFSIKTNRVVEWHDNGNLRVGLAATSMTQTQILSQSATQTTTAASNKAVRQAQKLLRDLGYQPGPIDGIYGSRTRQTIKLFQADERLSQTGTIDNGLINQLVIGKQRNTELVPHCWTVWQRS